MIGQDFSNLELTESVHGYQVQPSYGQDRDCFITRFSAAADANTLFVDCDRRHVRVPHFINESAVRRLHRWLKEANSWGLTLSDGDRILGLAPTEYRSCRSNRLEECTAVAYSAARKGFAFIREELWDGKRNESMKSICSDPMLAFRELIGSTTFKQYIATVVGQKEVELVRLTVERYACGHFFAFTSGAPADAEIGFSFDLTETWVSEWGGLLEFCDFFGSVECGYLPEFNTLTVYDLAKSRGISFVSPLSRRDRYLIVGQMAVPRSSKW